MTIDGIYGFAFNAALAGEMLIAPDQEFTILAVNDSLLRMLCRKREELVGKRVFQEFPSNPDDPHDTGASSLHQSLTRVLATGQPDELPMQRYPIAIPMPDGSPRYEERFWSASSTPVFDESGNLVCISHRTADVTEQKRASQVASFHIAREKFQLMLADRVRPLTNPDEVTAAACELLGEQLNAGRVLYGEVDESGNFLDMGHD